MDDALINNINKTVGEHDTLYHLGDFCFAPKNEYFRVASNYRRRINCKNIYFLWGNHDNFAIRGLFTNCYDILNVNVEGQRIVLCHYAMAIWDGSHKGTIACYGHSHANAEEWLDKAMPGRRSMDVGVDNAVKILGEYRPFSFEEISKIMSKRKSFHFDNHGKGPTEVELIG